MILKADRNCFLTQAQDVANIEDRQFKELVYIATAADAAAWRQVTEAEKASLINRGTVLDVNNLTADYLAQVETLIGQIPQVINTKTLTANEALAHQDWYPVWGGEGAEMGTQVDAGFRLRHDGTLYEVIQPHALQADWMPGTDTASLYKVVTATHAGTREDPIPYRQMMAIEQGKYYTQYGVLYIGISTTSTGFPNDLESLHTLVKRVEE